MARPVSHVTLAVRVALADRTAREAVATWRDVLADLAAQGVINPAAPAEVALVRRTVDHMGRRGELDRAEPVRVPGSRRPMVGWRMRAPGSEAATQGSWMGGPHAALQQALGLWRAAA